MSRTMLYTTSILLGLISIGITAYGATGLASILFLVSIGLAAFGMQISEGQVHYHFHGDKKEQTEAFKSVTEATEQSVEMPDGRIARVRKVRQWH